MPMLRAASLGAVARRRFVLRRDGQGRRDQRLYAGRRAYLFGPLWRWHHAALRGLRRLFARHARRRGREALLAGAPPSRVLGLPPSVQLPLRSIAFHLHFVDASVRDVILEDAPDIVNRL